MLSALLLTTLAAAPPAGLAPAPGEAQPAAVERTAFAMGTEVWLAVEAGDRATALAASEAALEALRGTEARLSTWTDDSELARLNATPPGVACSLSPESVADLVFALEIADETNGAFDAGVGALVRAWDLRGNGRRPSAQEIERALACGGVRALTVEGTRATRGHADLVLEEGGFGKGSGLRAAIAALRAAGALRGVIDLGGQVALFGLEEPRTVPVADPARRDRAAVVLALASGCLATSGNSERGVEADGVRLGHILDPRTGSPAPDFGSVSVWTEDARRADALSTALYVMGPERGAEWAALHDGVEALFLVREGDRLRARATRGLQPHIQDRADGLEIEFVDPLPPHSTREGRVSRTNR